MSNLEYEEKYGEKVLTDKQIEEEQQRIDEREQIDIVKKQIKIINEILNDEELNKDALIRELKELKDITEEMWWIKKIY